MAHRSCWWPPPLKREPLGDLESWTQVSSSPFRPTFWGPNRTAEQPIFALFSEMTFQNYKPAPLECLNGPLLMCFFINSLCHLGPSLKSTDLTWSQIPCAWLYASMNIKAYSVTWFSLSVEPSTSKLKQENSQEAHETSVSVPKWAANGFSAIFSLYALDIDMIVL